MPMDGLYYQHRCDACRSTSYDCLPQLLCPTCQSPDVAVVFDAAKRAAELAKLQSQRSRSEALERRGAKSTREHK